MLAKTIYNLIIVYIIYIFAIENRLMSSLSNLYI